MNRSPIILAVETATDTCSVALLCDDACYSRCQIAIKAHTQFVFSLIEEVLAEAQLPLTAITALAVGRGPGSFTGVRIAVCLIQGLAFGLHLPVYPISTLSALAFAVDEDQRANEALIVPALDARMQEVYFCVVRKSNLCLTTIAAEAVSSQKQMLAQISLYKAPLLGVGSGWRDIMINSTDIPSGLSMIAPEQFPHAKHIALLAKREIAAGKAGMAAEAVLPVYVRDQVTSS